MDNSWRGFCGKIKHKFNAKKVIDNGENFSSKLEFSYKQHLDIQKKSAIILFYLTQVPIRLPGRTKYIVDFLVFYKDGNVRFLDTKGVETDTFRIKKREIEAIYPFEIEIIKKGDF